MDVIPNDQYILELILLIWAIGALVIIITQARNTKSLKASLLRGTVVNLAYTVVISLTWFYAIATDGFSQVLGVYFFAGIFLILEIVLFIVLLLVKRKKLAIS
ncbi:hypothetical protein ADM98_08865 [Exiguobacterium sp. BMC-KP]|uniref:hypothetical protein n=1 Tax=Exiguobacterium sp. BMC-KP TaxID=1684312 RepID=UPI0006AA4C1E|nr:hypothetical protein [Exiguobacterium sp. BMC-KP]KOP29019.1 hypothetical protein ADM98_08865 [Exiguobacterium sp. BMC-KP]